MPVKKDFANLDLLRAVAVLSVYCEHLCSLLDVQPFGFLPNYYLGRYGVMIFFVHTCLVLMYSMERLGSGGLQLARNFYIRRIFRIYPLSIVVCLMMFFLRLPASLTTPPEAYKPVALGALFSNLALIQNLTLSDSILGALWSLPLEVQMYLVLPLLFTLVRYTDKVWPALAMWTIAVVLALIQVRVSYRLNIFSFAPCFLGGILAYQISKKHRSKLPGWLWPLALLFCTAMFMVLPGDHLNWYKNWAICLMLGAMIPRFEEITFSPLRLFAHLVAKYSYGIYLSHAPLMWVCHYALPKNWQGWPSWTILALGSLILPVVMFHLIESPFMSLGASLAKRLQKAPETVANVPASAPAS